MIFLGIGIIVYRLTCYNKVSRKRTQRVMYGKLVSR